MTHIEHPVLKSARQLTPMEMNNIHFDKKHTVLTPENLSKLSSAANTNTDNQTNK